MDRTEEPTTPPVDRTQGRVDEARRRADRLVAEDLRHRPGDVRSHPGRSPDLVAQTPGLDMERPIRDLRIRLAAWVRERPLLSLAVLGAVLLYLRLTR